ncbi:hypothetical protein B484DRAFT_94924 [Ochromonadaceae sp. CCMP2298]|nr:hypothetical protein B484DRAFT_94924 [Ochromonadaceae sp. CCMP2298]
MVKLHPVKPIILISPDERVAKTSEPNRFNSDTYDRSVVGQDECTKLTGGCQCYMCCLTPLVIVSSGETTCEEYNISLRNVREFMDGGLVKTLHEETMMIYCQVKKDGSSQVGIFAAVDVEDCLNNAVRRHENVTNEEDVTVMNDAKPTKFTYVDPVMLMYRESTNVNDVISRIVSTRQPIRLREGTGLDEDHSFSHSGRSRSSTNCQSDTRSRSNTGYATQMNSPICGSPGPRHGSPALPDSPEFPPYVEEEAHYLWPIDDPADMAALQHAFADVESLYIADGHHRTAAACQAMLKRSNGVAKVASNRFLTALIFPDSHLSVLPYNRCVKHLAASLTPEVLLERISEAFSVELVDNGDTHGSFSAHTSGLSAGSAGIADVDTDPATDSTDADADMAAAAGVGAGWPGYNIGMYLDSRWYKLHPLLVKSEDIPNPLNTIDAQILLEHLLYPILAMNEPGSENYMIYVDGREGKAGVERIVHSGEAALGFVVGAVSTGQIMDVADAALLLPPKATFFDPKPQPKLLLRLLR